MFLPILVLGLNIIEAPSALYGRGETADVVHGVLDGEALVLQDGLWDDLVRVRPEVHREWHAGTLGQRRHNQKMVT